MVQVLNKRIRATPESPWTQGIHVMLTHIRKTVADNERSSKYSSSERQEIIIRHVEATFDWFLDWDVPVPAIQQHMASTSFAKTKIENDLLASLARVTNINPGELKLDPHLWLNKFQELDRAIRWVP